MTSRKKGTFYRKPDCKKLKKEGRKKKKIRKWEGTKNGKKYQCL